MEKLIELEQVGFVREGKTILSNLNWTTQEGEHWVILGPNGAGKTTVASFLAGRNHPSSGKIRILGEALGRIPVSEFHERVGFCSSALLNKIPAQVRVKELVLSAAYGTIVKTRGQFYEAIDQVRSTDLMHLFGVDQLAERRLSTLSDGERQRVLISRALMADPEILILDEPVAGVDLGARELLLNALDELSKDPRSPQIILVTHHLEEIPAGFNRALLMQAGQIVAAGEITRVLQSERLSATFGYPLHCGQTEDGRWWAHG